VFGETALARSELLKTAEIIDSSDGQLEDTVSPLIWVMMLWDYYVYTGDSRLFDETKNAQIKILSEFQSYMGTNDLPEKNKDYSSVDKVTIDGFDMMHPPCNDNFNHCIFSCFSIPFIYIQRIQIVILQVPDAPEKLHFGSRNGRCLFAQW
jgi:hypothetical protein